MGQKLHPVAARLGSSTTSSRTWRSIQYHPNASGYMRDFINASTINSTIYSAFSTPIPKNLKEHISTKYELTVGSLYFQPGTIHVQLLNNPLLYPTIILDKTKKKKHRPFKPGSPSFIRFSEGQDALNKPTKRIKSTGPKLNYKKSTFSSHSK